jgi:hypothetical protein
MSAATLAGNGNGHAGIVWPFGRFKGQPLYRINSGYLAWIMQHRDTWDAALVADVSDELNRRDRARRPPKLDRTLTRWKLKLQRRYQGDPKALRVVQEASELLEAMLGKGTSDDRG